MKLLGLVAVALAAIAGCGKSTADEETQVAPATIPPPPAVTDSAGAYVLRYFAPASGQLLPVKTPAEVPEGARAQVVVTYEDAALQGPWLYVADLTQKQGAGYAVRAVDRQELESQIAAARPKPAAAPAADPGAKPAQAAGAAPSNQAAGAAPAHADSDVVIFRTAWCGYCKKTAEYLTLKGVPFVEKDLERDAGARQDMLARAKRAGVPESRLQGVPILSVKGKIITGFDRNAIDRALGG